MNEAEIRRIVREVISEEPELIIEVLLKRKEILKGLLSDDIPQNIATKDDIKMIIEFMNRRFEDINRRFEDVNRRFEDVNKRFEDMNRQFEDMNRRFEFIQKLILFLLGLNLVETGTTILILLKVLGIIIT